MTPLRIETPRAFVPLLEPSRYKGLYGGRGGAKSHFFAELLVERCYMATTRGVCIREVQNSIKESVRQLLVDKIAKFGLNDFFEVLETEIRGKNGSLIIFKGMQSYNSDNIKSLEGFDIAWWEEAHTASARSWRLLRPTIRKEGSEIWASWNPEDDEDPVDEFFRGPNPFPGAIAVRVGWKDNPWFPDVLRDEMEADYAADAEMASHVWGGDYLIITEGAYYAKHMAEVQNEDRIGHFPYDPALPVITAWDIGVDDYTAIWFFQVNGQQVRAIDYHEYSGVGPEDIIPDCMPELLPADRATERTERIAHLERGKGFKYAKHYLPHDVEVREWGGGAKTRRQMLMKFGVKPIIKGAQQGPAERISATRALLPMVSFNHDTCRLGIKRMRKYKRKEILRTGQYGTPDKDGNDHCADAFGEFAVNCGIRPKAKTAPKPKKTDYKPAQPQEAHGWR